MVNSIDSSNVSIRRAVHADLGPITGIYNHFVEMTPISFDCQPFRVDQREAWFGHYKAAGRHQLFVAMCDGEVAGYACSSPFRPKAAYATSVETSVYVDPQLLGRGIGFALYNHLLAVLRDEDVHRAYAGITLPNAASVALHRRFGFEEVGVMTEAGYKFDRYWDVAWYEKRFPTQSEA